MCAMPVIRGRCGPSAAGATWLPAIAKTKVTAASFIKCSSPSQSQAQPEGALVDALPPRIRDAQGLHERAVIDAVGRVGVVWRVGEIKDLGPKLQMKAFPKPKVAVQTQVRVD